MENFGKMGKIKKCAIKMMENIYQLVFINPE